MKIRHVEIEVTDPASAGEFFAETLALPTTKNDQGTLVRIGSSTLQLKPGAATEGVHHLAFDIPIDQFAEHREWLVQRSELLRSARGDDEFEASPAWNARSLYFSGPDRMVLELIARREQQWPVSDKMVPNLLSISEVGIAVPDVLAAVDDLKDQLGAGVLGTASGTFAPVGDHDGLMILVSPDRGWWPVQDMVAQPLPTRIWIESDRPVSELKLNALTTLQLCIRN